MDSAFKSPAVLSFFPGVLGLERGLERAIGKIRVMAYVEIEAFIIANLVAGMEAGVVDPAPIWTDAKTFNASPFRGKIHGIIAGYPCPGESLAGLREGHLYKGFLWPAIRKAISATRPLWCFFENVDDHLTGTFPIVLRSLHNMGYRVEVGIFTAEEVGAPQERERLFILAVANSHCSSTIRELRNLCQESSENEKKTWQRQWSRNEFEHSNKKMGFAKSQRFQGYIPLHLNPSEKANKKGRSRTFRTDSKNRWPAGQGYFQHPWEAPRSIKSGMGYTIERYNFEGDLLRANGNSVVEQTAELAWLTLLDKYGIE